MNIHVVEVTNNFTKLDGNLWESRWWNLDESTAQELVGGEIYFHKKRQEPSFYGGTITGYRVEEEGDSQGKIIFTLRHSQSCRNVRTDKAGWTKDIKITEPDQPEAL